MICELSKSTMYGMIICILKILQLLKASANAKIPATMKLEFHLQILNIVHLLGMLLYFMKQH